MEERSRVGAFISSEGRHATDIACSCSYNWRAGPSLCCAPSSLCWRQLLGRSSLISSIPSSTWPKLLLA